MQYLPSVWDRMRYEDTPWWEHLVITLQWGGAAWVTSKDGRDCEVPEKLASLDEAQEWAARATRELLAACTVEG